MKNSRVVIFANGQLSRPEKLRALLRKDDFIICADGGANHALTLGLLPDLLIGDLDSIAPKNLAILQNRGVKIESALCDQSKTDLEVSLDHARSIGAREVLLLTSLGGRLDHTLANLMIASREDLQGIQLSFFDGETYAIFVHSGQSVTLHGHSGDVISLIPFTKTATGLSLDKVKWPLNEATLKRGSTLSISNQMTSKNCTLSLDRGTVLILHTPKAVK